MRGGLLHRPATGQPLAFADAVTSGLSVGVPGTPATWALALDRWGSIDLKQALRPAAQLARQGFVVDETFRQQTADNAERFAAFPSTRELFLPGGAPPAVGSVLRNPDLARTYTLLGRRGTDYLYEGRLGEEIVATVQQPPVDPASTRVVRPGLMQQRDLDRLPRPAQGTHTDQLPRADRCRDGTAVLRRLDDG